MQQKWKKIATISRTFERCQENNIGISKHLLRQLCLSGQIPVIKAGNVNLINWDQLMKFLDGELVQVSEQAKSGEIKRIPEKLTAVK